MPDGYTNTMQAHATNCYMAHGMTQQGADQLANNQAPTSGADAAMMQAYKSTPSNYDNNGMTAQDQQKMGVPGGGVMAASQPDTQMSGGNVWGDGGSASPAAGPAGGNVWGSGGSGVPDKSASASNLW